MRILTLLAVLGASPAMASYDRLPVTQVSQADFAVGYRAGADLSNFLCAAGRHVTNTLGLPGKTRVYRLSPPPRKSGQGISFTLDAAKSAGDLGISTFGGQQDGGFNASTAQAEFCNARRPANR